MMVFFQDFRPRQAFLAAAVTLLGATMAQAAEPATPSPPKLGGGTGAPEASTAPGAQNAQADPVVAKVNNQDIRLSDVNDAARTLPEQLRNLPPQMLYPMVLNQLIDRKALAIEARREGLDKDPAVQRQMDDAADRALQNALLTKEVAPK